MAVPPAKVPLAGTVLSVILQMTTFGILAVCLMRRIPITRSWSTLPLASWLVLIIYIDSALFVFATAIVTRGIGINESKEICDGGILLCLLCYMTTKILIYYFLVEKAYIVRGSRYPRLKTKLWLFNCFAMMLPYCVVVVMNFIFRIAYINEDGVCIIGMEKISMIPLISFDVVVNVYLTLLFVLPLRKLYSYQNNMNASLRTIAWRSFVGSCATLTSSVVNLTILMVLKGEPGWICLMCCNADILFSVLVLHWVTEVDRSPNSSSAQSGNQRSNAALSHAGDDTKKSQLGSQLGAPRSVRHSLNMRNNSKGLGSTMTTEIVALPSKGRQDSYDDDVELRGQIRVHTERTQEVEVDARSEGSACGYSAQSGVTVEKMV